MIVERCFFLTVGAAPAGLVMIIAGEASGVHWLGRVGFALTAPIIVILGLACFFGVLMAPGMLMMDRPPKRLREKAYAFVLAVFWVGWASMWCYIAYNAIIGPSLHL